MVWMRKTERTTTKMTPVTMIDISVPVAATV